MKYLLIESTIDKSKHVLIETSDGIKQFSQDTENDEWFNNWYSSSKDKQPIEELVTGSTYYAITEGTYSGDAEAKARELIGK